MVYSTYHQIIFSDLTVPCYHQKVHACVLRLAGGTLYKCNCIIFLIQSLISIYSILFCITFIVFFVLLFDKENNKIGTHTNQQHQ